MASKRKGKGKAGAKAVSSSKSQNESAPAHRFDPRAGGTQSSDDSASSPLIGHALRAQRRKLNLTLDALAEQVGLTKGFLSDVENDKASPSISSLLQLCSALNLSIGSLFTSKRGAVVRANKRPQIKFYGVGLTDYLLTARSASSLVVLWTEVEPGGKGGKQPYWVPCDENFVLVVDGTVVFTFDDEEHVLNTGDALTYSARRPHNFVNPSATDIATVLFVMTPPPN